MIEFLIYTTIRKFKFFKNNFFFKEINSLIQQWFTELNWPNGTVKTFSKFDFIFIIYNIMHHNCFQDW